MKAITLSALVLIIPFSTFAAPQQQTEKAVSEPHRSGWTYGLHAGYGHMTVQNQLDSDCGARTCLFDANAVSVDLRVGYFVSPRLAALAEVWMVISPDDLTVSGQAHYTAAIQGWVTNSLWLKAGGGPPARTLSSKLPP